MKCAVNMFEIERNIWEMEVRLFTLVLCSQLPSTFRHRWTGAGVRPASQQQDDLSTATARDSLLTGVVIGHCKIVFIDLLF